MNTEPTPITTDAELRALDEEQIVAEWRAGRIDSNAIAAERERRRTDNATANAAAHRKRNH